MTVGKSERGKSSRTAMPAAPKLTMKYAATLIWADALRKIAGSNTYAPLVEGIIKPRSATRRARPRKEKEKARKAAKEARAKNSDG